MDRKWAEMGKGGEMLKLSSLTLSPFSTSFSAKKRMFLSQRI
jgi:hypothetical protein